MKHLIHNNHTRFLSSLASIHTKPLNPSNFITPFDPFQFLNESTKSRSFTLRETNIIHTQFLKSNLLHSDADLSNFLLSSYVKASSFGYAHNVFDGMCERDISSWNLIIGCWNRELKYADSWGMFCKLRSLGFYPNEFTYGSVLSACIGFSFVNGGRLIYALALKHGFALDGYVRSGLIDLFLKSWCFEDALRVFYDEYCGNVVCWNAIISGAVKHNEDAVGLNLFRQMCSGNPSPNKFTFPSVFGACAKREKLELGKGVHGLVIKYGEQEDLVVGTAIVDFYAKCGEVDEALKKFSRMSVRNVVSWTAIITGFVQKGEHQSALKLFKEMIILKEEINIYTVTSVLSGCTNPVSFQVHCWTYKTGFYSDSTVKNSLINLYSKTGSIELSEEVFRDTKDLKNPSTWSAMITSFSHNGSLEKAFGMLKRMFWEGLTPDISCIPSLLSIINRLELGEQIHCYTRKTGVFFNPLVGCSLSTMYSKCGSLNDSYEIFEQIHDKDNVSWASMIAGFTEHGFAYKAIELFREMILSDVILDDTTLTAVLPACTSLQVLKLGKEIHGFFIKKQDSKFVYGGSPIVNMYSKCGELKLANKVFSMMPFKDQISCSSLLSGYAQNGYAKEALLLFLELRSSGLKIDSFTVSTVLGAVGDLNQTDIGIGIQLHAYILKLGFESDDPVGSSLVTMYSKCGAVDDCYKAFEQIYKPDLISWTSMINSYAQHGKGLEALKVYDLMTKSGTKPDFVTFVGVLTACSHSGLVNEGYAYLKSMVNDYGIQPGQRHYACMVDILGRSGKLKEAERFIRSMPIEPGALVWGTLLAACKVHGDVEIGKIAAERFIELEPSSDGGYVALSNICADVGQWEEVLKIRDEMKGTGIKKEAGWSYV
ncbi:Pentatricopeptide repeat-containing protein [Artemisia annua]|uniref:Pentatricopeptide repeat-containing protein n=1 Tax=Artemisia annua TaxID=35608 RepID=A0A2U1LF65_ARTAN|nr:Pentatricopeptide repeat-containing protein [Artemisia annua]